MRHDETQSYAEKGASLSENGIAHIKSVVADTVFNQLNIDSGEPEIVLFISSPYRRALQTSKVLKNEIAGRLRTNTTRIAGIYPIDVLHADDTLAPYMNVMPKTEAYTGWINAETEFETYVLDNLPRNAILRTRDMISELTLDTIKRINRTAHQKPGIPLKIIAVTHETTIGSVLYSLYNKKRPVKYGEGITIVAGSTDNKVFFQNEEGEVVTKDFKD
jgi:broad specificity phosphatase PhoE